MKIRNDFIALSSGALLAITYPPFKFGFLACIGFLPLFYLMKTEKGCRGFRLGYFWGFGFNLTMLYWIIWSTIPGGISAVFFLPLYSGVFFYVMFYTYRKLGKKSVLLFPFFWTALEYVRSQGALGFPWTSLAHTQTYYPSLIQYSSFTGMYGVTFWVCWLNVLFYLLLRNLKNYKRLIYYTAVLCLIILIPFLYGHSLVEKGDYLNKDRKIKVSVIQANIDPDVKWDKNFRDMNFTTYEKLSMEAAQQNPSLFIWPETAATCYPRLPQYAYYRNWIDRIINETNIPLITGTLDYKFVPKSEEYRYFNSAFYFHPGKKEFEDYAKIKLVPIGERMPWEEYFPFLSKLDMGQANFYPGAEEKVFSIFNGDDQEEEIKFSIGICFESIFPDLIRIFCNNGAEFMVIITNDCWFGRTSAPFQHAQASVFRAIENRIGIARNANTGVSMIIDPYGRIQTQTPIFEERIMTGEVFLRNTTTFYTRYGDIFSYIIIMIALMALLEIIFIFEKK